MVVSSANYPISYHRMGAMGLPATLVVVLVESDGGEEERRGWD